MIFKLSHYHFFCLDAINMCAGAALMGDGLSGQSACFFFGRLSTRQARKAQQLHQRTFAAQMAQVVQQDAPASDITTKVPRTVLRRSPRLP